MFLLEFSGHVIQYNPPMGPHFESIEADVQEVEPCDKYLETIASETLNLMAKSRFVSPK